MDLSFITPEQKKLIEEMSLDTLIKSYFTIGTLTGGTVNASVINDRFNGNQLLLDIDNSKTDKTSDDGGCTMINKKQLEDLIVALIALRKVIE